MGEVRTDKFAVGDVVEWNTPIVMQHCRTWAPDITKPVTVIAVSSIDNEHLQRAGGHTQLVRIEPNYCPWGDEFSGTWFKPKSPPDARDATIFTLRLAVEKAKEALEPFKRIADAKDYRLGRRRRRARSAIAALAAVTPSKGE